MKPFLVKFIEFISSLKLTIFCLSAALLLVFAGTLAQVRYGIDIVQERYFQSLFIWWPPVETGGFRIPVFPGGHLIGGLLLANLIAAHVRRFQWGWKKVGIQLTHGGLIIMLAGGLLTDLFSVESFMRIQEGETKRYSESFLERELAVIDTSDPSLDRVVAIPEDRLEPGRLISHESLPFRIVVKDYLVNSELKMIAPTDTESKPASSRGSGARILLTKQSRATGMKDRDTRSAVVELIAGPDAADGAGLLGTWLVSDALAQPQTVEVGGKVWTLTLRAKRYYKPFSLTLHEFTHERYPGTQIPKDFSSEVTLNDEDTGESREALIYMNHPLRYGGETFYQAGFERTEDVTVLQVVRNPSFVAPYIGCVVVGVGLLLQFGMHLVGFAGRRKALSKT